MPVTGDRADMVFIQGGTFGMGSDKRSSPTVNGLQRGPSPQKVDSIPQSRISASGR